MKEEIKTPLQIKDLKIQSFVTALTDAEKKRIRGGCPQCPDQNTGGGNTMQASCYYYCS